MKTLASKSNEHPSLKKWMHNYKLTFYRVWFDSVPLSTPAGMRPFREQLSFPWSSQASPCHLFVFTTLTYKHWAFRFPTSKTVHRLVATVLSSSMMLSHSEILRSCVEEWELGNRRCRSSLVQTRMCLRVNILLMTPWKCSFFTLANHTRTPIMYFWSSPATHPLMCWTMWFGKSQQNNVTWLEWEHQHKVKPVDRIQTIHWWGKFK